ncbi:AMP-binding protein [Mycolicibacterium porcinum]|uniref:AMP-binding protein n=1 Tax=Mycolicibacterium porcinum TaxID=39693 RepID=A0AAW5SVQ1_9MYCO|nr:AMP-binding protein [Mycolicibacterium porcinum]MCV7386457.1 AMP-binding protein [Mycolicibacterium porcinum]CDO30872.1 long-chain-fatty-acid--CoA ligase [Mycolicibacterium vulneris]
MATFSFSPVVESVQTSHIGLYDRLLQHRDGEPHKLAVVTGDERWTYAQFVDRIDAVAALVAARGVGAHGRVLWLGANSHHVVELLIACCRLGATLCPANWRQSPEELEFTLSDWDPDLVVWQKVPGDDRLTALRDQHMSSSTTAWLAVDADDGYEVEVRAALARGDAAPQEATPTPASAALALYTAAFSGRPGAALLTEEGMYLQGLTHISVLELTADDINLVATPLFHVLGWVSLLSALVCGCTNVFVPRPGAEEICHAIVDNDATTGAVMPQTAIQIAEFNAERRFDLTRFRSAVRVRGWRDMTKPGTMVAGYGQTETGGPVLLPLPGSRLGGPIQGRPSPVARVRIVDHSGRDVSVGETGEILAAGPTVTLGYWNRPQANAERRVGRWWNTTDLGRRDEDGVITFLGPNRRMIKSGGENVYPAEVESCLEAHPAVASAALVGVADKTWGQIVTAVVVLRRGSVVDADTLIAHTQDKLARYKAPRHVHFIDALPKTASGATDHQALDDRFGGGNYPGSA